ncbi:MAG: hypothetical protein ACE14S_01980 [Candidatus Bathyarchaeia archaeon]
MSEKAIQTTHGISIGLIVFIVACAYFAMAQYYLINSAIFSNLIITTFSEHARLMEQPWWIATFYASELGGTVGGILRSIGSFFALYAAFQYWRKKDAALPTVRARIGTALLLEAGYFLCFIPTVFLGFVYPLTGGNLWYFGTTPVNEVLFVAGFAPLLMVTIVAPVLLRLRSKVVSSSPSPDMAKWGCVAGLSYLFVVFWFNVTMQWTGMLTTFGAQILLDPVNLAGFVASVLGLLAVALSGLQSLLPVIKGKPATLNPRRIGVTAVGFGCYFIVGTAFYLLAGGFAARPWAWYEMIVPHNPYLWCMVFAFAGLPLLFRSAPSNLTRMYSEKTQTGATWQKTSPSNVKA